MGGEGGLEAGEEEERGVEAAYWKDRGAVKGRFSLGKRTGREVEE